LQRLPRARFTPSPEPFACRWVVESRRAQNPGLEGRLLGVRAPVVRREGTQFHHFAPGRTPASFQSYPRRSQEPDRLLFARDEDKAVLGSQGPTQSGYGAYRL